jgi:hypothetical protein
MSPELFARIGEALYGDQFVASLSHQLEVAKRTVARWASGQSRIPPSIGQELRQLLAQRADLVAAVRDELEAAIGQAGDTSCAG